MKSTDNNKSINKKKIKRTKCQCIIDFFYEGLSKDELKEISNYKNKDKDDSKIYEKFLLPIAKKISHKLTKKTSSNALLILGFILELISHIYTMQDEKNNPEYQLTRFTCFLQGFAHFSNIILIKSSHLHLKKTKGDLIYSNLLEKCLNVFTLIINCININHLFNLQNKGIISFLLNLSLYSDFFMSHFQEYSDKTNNKISFLSRQDETNVFISIISLMEGLFPGIFQKYFYSISLGKWIVFIIFVIVFITIIDCFYELFVHLKFEKFLYCFGELFIYYNAVFIPLFSYAFGFDFMEKYYKLSILCSSLVYARACLKIIFMKFENSKITLTNIGLFTIANILLLYGRTLYDDVLAEKIYIVCCIIMGFDIFFIINVRSRQILKYLNIKLFQVYTK